MSASEQPATLAEIADHFGWPRSSTFNLLAALSEKGYLYEPRPRAGFYPTPRWLAMARMISEVEPLPPWTHTLISDLSAETGELSDNHDIISLKAENLYALNRNAGSKDSDGPKKSGGRGGNSRVGQKESGSWSWFLFKVVMFLGACVGGYVGWTIYRTKARASRF